MGISIKKGVAVYKENMKKLREEQKRRKEHNEEFSETGRKYGGAVMKARGGTFKGTF
jgi:uncharacterized protein with GYD domain